MLSPTKILPEVYRQEQSIDLSQNRKLVIWLNVAGLIFFFLFGITYLRLLVWIRPAASLTFGCSNWIINLATLLVVYTGVIVFHEVIHGLFFWIITRERPKFGFRGAYAFAAAPDWYLPRNHYFIIGLAPFIMITLSGLILLPITPETLLVWVGFATTANASGAVGDLAIVFWLLTRYPAGILVRDLGDAIDIYYPGKI